MGISTWPERAYQNRIELLQGTLDMLILRTLQWGLAAWARHQAGDRPSSSDVCRSTTGRSTSLHRLEEQGNRSCRNGSRREQTAGEVLPADRPRKKAVGRGQLALKSDCRSDRQGDEAGLSVFRKSLAVGAANGIWTTRSRFHLAQEARLRSEPGATPDAAPWSRAARSAVSRW